MDHTETNELVALQRACEDRRKSTIQLREVVKSLLARLDKVEPGTIVSSGRFTLQLAHWSHGEEGWRFSSKRDGRMEWSVKLNHSNGPDEDAERWHLVLFAEHAQEFVLALAETERERYEKSLAAIGDVRRVEVRS